MGLEGKKEKVPGKGRHGGEDRKRRGNDVAKNRREPFFEGVSG